LRPGEARELLSGKAKKIDKIHGKKGELQYGRKGAHLILEQVAG